MDPATELPAADAAEPPRPNRRRRWLRTDEGWAPSEDAVRLLGAVAIALLAVGLKLAIVRVLGGELGYLSYVGAVALAAWIAGSRGGLITTIICAFAETALFSGSLGDLLASPSTLFGLGLFLFDGIVVTVITSRLRQAMVLERSARAIGDARLETQSAALRAAERDRAALVSLQSVTASLAGAATPVEVADAILDRGLTALGALAGGVGHLADDGRALDLIAARGYSEDAIRTWSRFELDGPSHLRDAVVGGRPIFLADPEEWIQRYPESPPAALPDSPTGGSLAVLPLLSGGRTIGTVVFRFATREELDEATRDLAVRLADQGAQALDRAMAYDGERHARGALERSQVRLTFLARTSELLGSGADFDVAASAVPSAAIPALADWCAVTLLDPDLNLLATAASPSTLEAPIERLAVLGPGDLGLWLVPEAAAGARAVSSRGDWSKHVIDPRAAAALEELGTRSLLVGSIGATAGKPLGSIVLASATPDRYGPDDLAMISDVAARIGVAAEQARLFATVARFKATVDASADAVYMFDPGSLEMTYVNRGGADLVGFDPDVLVGRSILQLQPTAPESVFRRRLADLRDDPGGSTAHTDVLTRSDGRQIPVDAILQEVTLPDGTRTAILTARDITDRIDVQARLTRIAGDERRQAAELRAVIQAMGEGILVVDPTGRVSLANDAAAAILLGDLPADIAELQQRLKLDPLTLDSARQGPHGLTEPAVEARTVQVDDGRWLEFASYPADLAGMATEEARSSRIVVIRDVTRAREAEAAREAFLGVLSHELRTPVTTIFGYAKVLQRPGPRPDQAEMLGDIEVEADRLYRIVEDLLALTRVEGGISIEGEPLLIQHLAGPVVTSEARRWSRIAFEIHLPPDLPAVFGERTYVEQVLRNLVSNAGKYSPDGTTVTIEAEATPGEVFVRVLDRGSGIDAEEADRLFDLYYRSPNTARSVAGAGIGLYVGRGLISAMGGRIWARPRPGGGSEFGFSLPRCEEDAAIPSGQVSL